MINYYVDHKRDVLVTSVAAKVSVQDVLEHIKAIKIDKKANSCVKELIELHGSGVGFSFPELFTIVEADQKRYGDDERYIAIVIESPVSYGLARMFMGLQVNKSYVIRIFRERDDAIEWLDSIVSTDQAFSLEGAGT
ncbi:MAG: hypothetical protein PVG89_07195 [Gammaproteobacteria bacterium]